MDDLESLFEELGGVAGVPDMAQHFDVTEREVRDWAAENDLPRVGNSFAFTLDHAEALAADLEREPAEADAEDEAVEVEVDEEDESDDQGEDAEDDA